MSEPEMNFKVGDKVVVRDYEDLKANFPTNPDGTIDTYHSNKFDDKCRKYCGMIGKITAIIEHPDKMVELCFDVCKPGIGRYYSFYANEIRSIAFKKLVNRSDFF